MNDAGKFRPKRPLTRTYASADVIPAKSKGDTSWGNVSGWYAEHLTGDDTYHEKVILPNLLRLVGPKAGMHVLDVATGEGYFARAFANAGATVVAADISPELIAKAKLQASSALFQVAASHHLAFAKENSFDAVTVVLALQNIERLQATIAECARVLKPGGMFAIVLNHPSFRIPKKSSWSFDPETNVQYRRIDGYLHEFKTAIVMNPGARGAQEQTTVSFHRPLQEYVKALAKAGFAIVDIEEWISHKKSQNGPKQKAEDLARSEFPLFMAIVATTR